MSVMVSSRRIPAYAAVYLFWGGSFLAIRHVVHVVPPFLAAATRYSLSGPILLLLSFLVRREAPPTRRQVLNCILTGIITFSCGYASVFWAETRLASWLVAILTATTFLWTYLGECLLLRTTQLSRAMLVPLLAGLLAMPLLLGANLHKGGMWSLTAMLVVLLGAVTSAGGTLLIKRMEMPRSFLQTAGFQLIAAGATLLIFSGLVGEWKGIRLPSQLFDRQSILGMTYLVCCGSLIAFSAYQWLLKHDKASMVATTTYVNPIVAMILGILFAHEQRSPLQIAGALALLASVAAVWHAQTNAARRAGLMASSNFKADLQPSL